MKYKTALITGASSGIGEVFATRLAERGVNLILVARSQKKLEELAKQYHEKYGIETYVIVSDLSKENAAKEVKSSVDELNLQVDMLINNAGFGQVGEFIENDPDMAHGQVMVNISALVDMSYLFATDMAARGKGAIINLASVAAFQPLPKMAVYGATKAFVLSFSEALWGELKNKGVKVLAICPGPTATKFFDVSGEFGAKNLRTSEQVVDTAMKALSKGKSYAIDGFGNYILANITRFFPREWIIKVAGSQVKPPKK
ncbi:SDR family NAD(P)-dependent oxidoreductase [Chengkuizengella axinellae]|uniref:SDR family oxidoreductase n=1 Tax=Chengkuizengella axinellae TaxID=3064388 RepID=A0ABT9J051_9BACL|nr:SDR family oxidoreductase [Chengkuizengella sp. 2205SS18-9]MDP5274772.1 SDR family oxidoreductase [Chengkuizengella sp. 2205SS18-9]